MPSPISPLKLAPQANSSPSSPRRSGQWATSEGPEIQCDLPAGHGGKHLNRTFYSRQDLDWHVDSEWSDEVVIQPTVINPSTTEVSVIAPITATLHPVKTGVKGLIPTDALQLAKDRQGWDDDEVIGVLLEYIENQRSDDVFADFLQAKMDVEDEMDAQDDRDIEEEIDGGELSVKEGGEEAKDE